MPDRQSRRQSVRPVRSERSEGKSVKPTLGRSGTASSVALHSTENNYINDFESACLEEGKSLPTWLEARKKYEQQSEFTEVAGELEEIIGKIMTNDGLEEDDHKNSLVIPYLEELNFELIDVINKEHIFKKN